MYFESLKKFYQNLVLIFFARDNIWVPVWFVNIADVN